MTNIDVTIFVLPGKDVMMTFHFSEENMVLGNQTSHLGEKGKNVPITRINLI